MLVERLAARGDPAHAGVGVLPGLGIGVAPKLRQNSSTASSALAPEASIWKNICSAASRPE